MQILNLSGNVLIDVEGDLLIGANLSGANLRGANLSGANLIGAIIRSVSLWNATIDGAIVRPNDIGGRGWILYALTDREAKLIEESRK